LSDASYLDTLLWQVAGNAKVSIDLKDGITDVIRDNFSDNDAEKIVKNSNSTGKNRFAYDATNEELSNAVKEALTQSAKTAYQRQVNKYAREGLEHPNEFVNREFSSTYYDSKNRHYYRDGQRVTKSNYYK